MLSKIKSIFSSGPKSALSIFALIVAWMILGAIFKGDENHIDRVESQDPHALSEVLVQKSTAQSINRELSILGETRYSRRVVITALTNGTVKSIPGEEGTLTAKNKSIIKLDNREALAKFQHAKSLKDKHALELDGYQKLFDQELISSAKLADAKAQFEGAKAELIQAQINLESTSVKLPFEGVVQKIMVEEGDYVRAGEEIAEILDFSPFIVSGDVSEKEAVYVQQGQKADATLIDGSVFHGHIAYKSTRAEPETRSFQIELQVDNEENNKILSGVSANIIIPIIHGKAHLVSTSTLEIDDAGKFGVKVLDNDNKVSFQTVEVLKSTAEGVWVSGLPEVATIIIRGQGFVKVGDIVNPRFESTADPAQASKNASTTEALN